MNTPPSSWNGFENVFISTGPSPISSRNHFLSGLRFASVTFRCRGASTASASSFGGVRVALLLDDVVRPACLAVPAAGPAARTAPRGAAESARAAEPGWRATGAARSRRHGASVKSGNVAVIRATGLERLQDTTGRGRFRLLRDVYVVCTHAYNQELTPSWRDAAPWIS